MQRHGRFSVQTHGRIIEIRVMGGFNLEGARAVFDAIRSHGVKLQDGPWATLADYNDFDLATPEVMAAWFEFAHGLDGMGRTHAAVVTRQSMVQDIVEEQFIGVAAQVRHFETRDEAVNWLMDAGFK